MAEAARLIVQGHGFLPCKCSTHNCIELRHELAAKIDIRKRAAFVAILGKEVRAPAPIIAPESTGKKA
jgi:hypothetical protein